MSTTPDPVASALGKRRWAKATEKEREEILAKLTAGRAKAAAKRSAKEVREKNRQRGEAKRAYWASPAGQAERARRAAKAAANRAKKLAKKLAENASLATN